MDTDILLKKYGLKYEDLNPVEKESFHNMVDSVKQGQLTLEKVKDYLHAMRDSLLLEMSSYDTGTKQDLFIKARIRNYTLLISLFETPEKAQKSLEQALRGVK